MDGAGIVSHDAIPISIVYFDYSEIVNFFRCELLWPQIFGKSNWLVQLTA